MRLLQLSNNLVQAQSQRFFFRGSLITEKNIRKAVFVGGRERNYVRGGERVTLEIKFRDCLSVNLDDLSTFLQLSNDLC